jgi:hypothetical protein
MSSERRPLVTPDLDESVPLPDIDELERQFAGTPSDAPVEAPFADATLTITRNAPDDVQDRPVTLWFDDEQWGILRYGQSLTRSVPAGHHRLKGHNTLIGTTFEFDATPGERIHLKCSNTIARGGALLMLLIGWAALRVRIERA